MNDIGINRQLNTISEWLLSNKLPLNVKKTKYMVVHTMQFIHQQDVREAYA